MKQKDLDKIEKAAYNHFKGLAITGFGEKKEIMNFLQLDCLAKDIAFLLEENKIRS